MIRLLDHIRPLTASIALIALLVAIGTTPMFADKAKHPAAAKAETSKDRSVKAAVTYATPINGAVTATIRAISAQRSQNTPKPQGKVNVGVDTSRKDNRFLFARAAQDVFTARIEIAQDEQILDMGIYNMLGKKVMDVYKGYSSRGQHDYTQAIADLPEGVYICIMQGSDFRKAEKFYFSR
ncbi:MAG: hypothetical protein NTX15_00880 [Candidatus Kapabacteria bacterium]|nr:hypothetical protein [Candidatus Kapabacteria bacterium]